MGLVGNAAGGLWLPICLVALRSGGCGGVSVLFNSVGVCYFVVCNLFAVWFELFWVGMLALLWFGLLSYGCWSDLLAV